MNQKERLKKDDGAELVDEGVYRSLIGCLMYLTTTRPDILFPCSKKQEIVAQSIAEAEFIAAAATVNQALWLRKILIDLQLEQIESTKILVDNYSNFLEKSWEFAAPDSGEVLLRVSGSALNGHPGGRITLVGLGSSASSPTSYHSLGEAAAAAAKSAQARNIAVSLASTDGLSAESKINSAPAIATGVMLGIFEDNRFRSESKTPALESLDILGLGTGPEIESKIKYAEHVCAGVILGRELVNAPANIVTP
ncbi:leucine aminopeptidase, chloroplastic-like, partial [Solanum stenotomum]|uniref:leucine aminopeptidase, chloroplastic-like n=1 Tax=Solanum stenotomum TaxID=172797 RepID=UPI0020D1BF21